MELRIVRLRESALVFGLLRADVVGTYMDMRMRLSKSYGCWCCMPGDTASSKE